MPFPKDFLWGTATASYQIEGSATAYGRGECIWHRFSHTDGKVKNNDTGDVACDHYHRYPQDVAMMKDLGVNSYRFSIAWSRVIPQGVGARNQPGLDFYDRLVDELLQANITPFATLYHWDLPQALQDKGGWANPESVDWFVDYTDLMTQRLGDRVKNWITHNEPWVIAFLGNLFGIHAPGIQDLPTALQVAHHLLISHGKAMPVIYQNVESAIAGITVNLTHAVPATDTDEDRQAAKRNDGFQNRWFLDPLYKGSYPEDMVALYQSHNALDGLDLDAVSVAKVATDFLGINFYNRSVVQADDNDPLLGLKHIMPEGAEVTAMGWEVRAPALTELLLRIKNDYNPPAIYITENGSAFDDPEPVNGIVEDPHRVNYLKDHLQAVETAIEQGVPMQGYFAWSLMDNFEWAEGYEKRFGIHYLNYETLERFPKRTALYYQQFIQDNRS